MLPAVAAAALLALTATACAPAPQGPQKLSVQRGQVGDQPVVAVTAPEGRPKALVVYLHGVGNDPTGLMRDAPLRSVVDALTADGYAVVGSEAHGDAFGSPASQQDQLDLIAAASARLGTDRTFLLAESMGGLAAVPLAQRGRVPGLLGVAGINAALSTSATDVDGYRALAEAAWGRPLTAADDPVQLPPADFAGERFRFYVSPGDEVVLTAEHSDAFATGAGSLADVEVVACSGGHVDPSCYQPTDLVRWFDALLAADDAA